MKNAMQLLEAVGQIQDDYIMDAHSEIPQSEESSYAGKLPLECRCVHP